MPTLYLGIDQSYSSCALVSYSPEFNAKETVFDFSPLRAGTGAQRLDHVYRTLGSYFTALDRASSVGRVCYEGYAYGKSYRREELGELGGILRLALVQTWPATRLHVVAPTTVKKFVTGSGRADKDKILLAVYMRWNYEASSHDTADAYTLARIAHALDQPEPPELRFQREVLETIRNPKTSVSRKQSA